MADASVGGEPAFAAAGPPGDRRVGKGRHHRARLQRRQSAGHERHRRSRRRPPKSSRTTFSGGCTGRCRARERSASSIAPTTRTCWSRACASSSPKRCGRSATTTSPRSSRCSPQGGTTIIKCCLLISKDEQRRRFEERLKDPQKRWKFQRGDLEDRALWKEYQAAYSEAIDAHVDQGRALVRRSRRTTSGIRNWAVSRLLIETLTDMDPKYPEPPDLAGITIT